MKGWRRKRKPQADTEKVILRIDAKTIIYINADEDKEKAKIKYLESLNHGKYTTQ